MKRSAVAVVALLVAGCGGTAGTTTAVQATTTTTHPPTWSEVAATLGPALDPSSPNPCQRGAPECTDTVLAEMRRRLRPLAAACDHRALFAQMYIETTEAISAAADRGEARDARALRHFTAWFARYYFTATDRWLSGRTGEVPGAWQVAFGAAADGTVSGLGDLLLGMNAHVSRDLAHTVADLVPANTTEIDPDFALVNDVIEQASVGILGRLASRFDPTIASAQIPIALGAQRSFGELVTLWRSESWSNGLSLRDAAATDRAVVDARIEASATLRAEAIRAATAYLPIVQSSRQRDDHCRAQG